MAKIFGKDYYLDLDGIVDKCRIENKIKETEEDDDLELTDEEPQTINIFKYEMIKMCVERILNEVDESDEEMGSFATNAMTVSFKIAYNTLIKNQILLEDE